VARPGQGLGENFTDSGQSILELLNRVGADGWELADREERQEHGGGPSYWEPGRLAIASLVILRSTTSLATSVSLRLLSRAYFLSS
jgi:hypothetical protein